MYHVPGEERIFGGPGEKRREKRSCQKDQVLTISYLLDIRDQLDDMLASLNLVIIVLIVSAGMLAFVVLYNLNSINITERQRETCDFESTWIL